MRIRGVVFAVLVVSAAHADDIIVLHSGKSVRCQVQRYSDGAFQCEMQDGITNKVASYNVKQIVFNAPPDEPAQGTIPGGAKANPGKPYSLTRLKPVESTAGWDQVRINTHPENKSPVVRGDICKDFIWAHAPSLVKFRVPKGTKRFTAVGVGYGGCRDCVFVIIVDGQRLAASQPLKDCPGNLANIAAELPKGAKEIRLVVENEGPTFWANPTFWE